MLRLHGSEVHGLALVVLRVRLDALSVQGEAHDGLVLDRPGETAARVGPVRVEVGKAGVDLEAPPCRSLPLALPRPTLHGPWMATLVASRCVGSSFTLHQGVQRP